jgi:hypothetical protein
MPKKEIPILIPGANPDIKRWLVLGLDPSMTRTGYALLGVTPKVKPLPPPSPGCVGVQMLVPGGTAAEWIDAGSVKPDKIEDPTMHPRNTLWIRGKAMALYLRDFLRQNTPPPSPQDNPYGDFDAATAAPTTGLIVSMEYPTPMNDYLVSLNRIIHLIFWEQPEPATLFRQVRILYTNASTLRSVMRLTKQGNNKGENILRAYEFIDKTEFPELDSDACDAVLLAMMGRHAASVTLGASQEIPANILNSLCNSTQEMKGKGRNAHLITKGLLHRPEYWFTYKRRLLELLVKDATNSSKRLRRVEVEI